MIHHPLNRQLPLWSFEFKSASRIELLSRRDMEQKLVKKTWQDELFKIRLLNAPKETLEEFFSIRFPETLSIEVREESENSIYLILPHNPYRDISEDELNKALGMYLEDIAGWMLEQQKGLLPDNRHSNISLVTKAWRDADFKSRLLTAPKQALKQELGLAFQDDTTIQVLEESADKAYIVIPFLPDHILAEEDSDLRQVNLPLVIGSVSPLPTDTFALDCTMTFTCPIP